MLVDCRPEELCLSFTCSNGLGPEVELAPDGSNVEVHGGNWRDYYTALLAWKLQGSFQAEVQAVKKGLLHLVDDRTMHMLHRCALLPCVLCMKCCDSSCVFNRQVANIASFAAHC